MSIKTFLLPDREATARFGEALGRQLQAGDLVALIGDLGAGKTTLTQAMARGLGIRVPVTSPTFTLIQEYPGPVPMFHFDPYRLERPEEVADLGWEEYLERGGVIVVEWADKIESLLPPERLTLTLEILPAATEESEESESPRRMTAEARGPRYVSLLDVLDSLQA